MKKKWRCRVYIDLFSGPGVSRIRGKDRLIWGSPFVALGVVDGFDHYLFCEADTMKYSALRSRMESLAPDARVEVVQGDANDKALELQSRLLELQGDGGALTFCMVDPYRMRDLDFETIRLLAQCRPIDFLVLIPTGMDATRNMELYLDECDGTVERFIGRRWREEWSEAVSRGTTFDRFLTDGFARSMQEIGYRYPGIESTQQIRSSEKNLPLYRLAFFSRHQLGEKFWSEAAKYSDPQLPLPF